MQIMQLYYALQLKQGVILIGPAGCGKSTMSKVLSKALNVLRVKNSEIVYEDDLVPERGMTLQYSQKLKVRFIYCFHSVIS